MKRAVLAIALAAVATCSFGFVGQIAKHILIAGGSTAGAASTAVNTAAATAAAAGGMTAETGLITTIAGAVSWLSMRKFDEQLQLMLQLTPSSPPELPSGWTYDATDSNGVPRILPPAVVTPKILASGSIVLIYTSTPNLPGRDADGTKRISPEFQSLTEAGYWLADFITCYFSGTDSCYKGERQVDPATGAGLIFSKPWEDIAASVNAWVVAGRPFANVPAYTERKYTFKSINAQNQYVMSYQLIDNVPTWPTFINQPDVTIIGHVPRVIDRTEVECPPGYTSDSTACVLTNPELIDPTRQQWSSDGRCAALNNGGKWVLNMFDPDCSSFSAVVKPNEVNLAPGDGSQVVVSAPPSPASPQVRVVRATPQNGNTTVEEATVVPANPSAPVSTANPPVPQQVTQSLVPGVQSVPVSNPAAPAPGAAAPVAPVNACGGPGQPRCSVALTSDSEIILGDDPGQLAPPSITDSVFSFVREFSSIKFSDRPKVPCATALDTSKYSTTLPLLDYKASMNLADTCSIIEPLEVTIRNVMAAVWLVFSIILFVRLTI